MTEEKKQPERYLSDVKLKDDDYDVLMFFKNARAVWDKFWILKYAVPVPDIEKVDDLGTKYTIILYDRKNQTMDVFDAILIDAVEMMKTYIRRNVEGAIIKKIKGLNLATSANTLKVTPDVIIDDVNFLLKTGSLVIV